MTPEILAAYLATLPDTAFQVELTDGNFSIKLNMMPPEPEAIKAAEKTAEAFYTGDGTPIPEALREYFPQLAKV